MLKSSIKFVEQHPKLDTPAGNITTDNTESFLDGLRIGKNNLQNCFYTKILHLTHQERFGFPGQKLLTGYGIISKISSNSIPLSLNQGGWQAIVDQLKNDISLGLEQAYGIGLYIYVNPNFRGQGIAGKLIQAMKEFCINSKINTLYIPLLLPSSKSKEHFNSNIEDYYNLTRNDGQYKDFWLRLHARNNAEIIRTDSRSHRFCADERILHSLCQNQPNLEVHQNKSDYLVKAQSNHYFFKNLQGSDIYICDIPCVWVKYQVNQA